jgi:hypothetical protein
MAPPGRAMKFPRDLTRIMQGFDGYGALGGVIA